MKIYESSLPNDFREEEIKQILDFVTTGKFCQLICVPGAGKASVLRFLAHNRSALKFHLGEKEKSVRFLYLNLYELPSYEEAQIAKFLLLSLDEKIKSPDDFLILSKQLTEAVNNLFLQNQSLVLLFDHFDEYQYRLPRSFFHLLRTLRNVAKYKFAVVFATRRDLKELVDPQILKDFYEFFVDNAVYLKINDDVSLTSLLTQTEAVYGKKLSEEVKTGILSHGGGHLKLTKVLSELYLRGSTSLETKVLLSKSIVTASLMEIWLTLTAQEQQSLIKLAQNKQLEDDNVKENLLKLDLVDEKSKFTIPLLEEFVKVRGPALSQEKITFNQDTKDIVKGSTILSDLLSAQEYRLLRFLLANQQRIVERDEIIKAVWPDAQSAEGISDEAIDQMIFRLRKKIEDEPNAPRHLLTVKGLGIRFEP